MYPLSAETRETLGIDQVATTLMNVEVELLYPGQWQKRESFENEPLEELTESMETSGINVVPIIVTPRSCGVGYAIIAGERRWRAAQRLQWSHVKCEVGKFSFQQALFISTVENLQRRDLNPIEEAVSYRDLADEFTDLSHDDIARQVGKSRAHVSNYLRLLQLDIKVRDALKNRSLTFAQARPLCSLKHHLDQRKIAEKAVKHGWSVAKISQEVSELTAKPKAVVRLSDTDADLRRLEREISEVTGLDCVVRRSPKGQWQLGFNAPESESFSGLLSRLGVAIDQDLEK